MPMMFPVKDMTDERLLAHWQTVRDNKGSVGEMVKFFAQEEMKRRGLKPGPVFPAGEPEEDERT